MAIGTGIFRVCAFAIYYLPSTGFIVWGINGRDWFPVGHGTAKEIQDQLYMLIDTDGRGKNAIL